MTPALRQAAHSVTVATRGQGLVPVTQPIAAWVAAQAMQTGLLTVLCQHTSASLLIQENADPDRARRPGGVLPPPGAGGGRLPARYRGADDMPAHIRSALTQSLAVDPVMGGVMALGTWQGLYVFEHRARPHRRTLALHLLGA